MSLASAATLFARIERELGGELSAEAILEVGREGLQGLGLTRQKASYLHELARRTDDGRLRISELGRMEDEEATRQLISVPGIGPWTAAIYLLMALRRPDVWPPGDLALHKAMSRPGSERSVPGTAEASEYAMRWRPWRSVAARILWHGYLEDRATGNGA